MTNTQKLMDSIIREYPAQIRDAQMTQRDRYAFEVGLALSRTPKGGRVADIGGGWGSFALGCAASGLQSTLVDDFRDSGFFNEEDMAAMRRVYDKYGLTVISRDVVANNLDFPDASLDTITIFDSLEHWHNSPKKVLARVTKIVRPGGSFIAGVPNCVNLRKRITVPLGRGKWSQMADWYEQDVFRAHVREPDVDDLHYIARDMRLADVQILGRNWSGYCSPSRLTRTVTPLVDALLRLRPSLCSDLYLIGKVTG